jgi:asparagine synthase (glutamine-hydrolysing)
MCGLIAVNCYQGRLLGLERALEAIQHRGPDDMGIFRSDGGDCHLGHVRLSILDLSTAGHQPMMDSTGRFVLTYNGEIYNHRDLRLGLQRRHGHILWRSGTDTEVILEGVAREGVDFLDRLNGIFAIAIYDKIERLLHVLRDPLGVKPLFMTDQNGAVRFGSEVKGLLALPGVTTSLRRDSLADQLAFMYVPEPYTMYNEVIKVEPGTCFSYRYGKLVSSRKYYSHLDQAIAISSECEAVERLRAALSTAVERQVIADVPVSILLSGGLDSSAVAVLATRSGTKIDSAYTIAFSDADRRQDAQSDDLRYAKIIADRLGLKLRVIPASEDFLSYLPKLVAFMEDGFTDPAAINTFLISKGASDAGVKVLLSGQGADEYLGGYRRYQAEIMLRRLPARMRGLIASSGEMLARCIPQQLGGVRRRLSRFSRLARELPTNRLLAMYTWSTRETILDLLVEPVSWDGPAQFSNMFARYAESSVLNSMMNIDRRYDLMSLNLCYTDRMSMAVGVEARVPFLDFDLVRLMNSIPAALKIRRGEGKYVLKKAMEGLLPRQIIYRQKAGFGLPIRAWMSRSIPLLDHYLDEKRIDSQGIFKPTAIRRLLDAQRQGRADYANTIFTLLCQQVWLDSGSTSTYRN